MTDPLNAYRFDSKIKILTWNDIAKDDLYDVYNEFKTPSSGINIKKLERFVVPTLSIRETSNSLNERHQVAYFKACNYADITYNREHLCPDLEGYKMEKKLVLKNGYYERNNRTSIEIQMVKCFENCHNDSDIEKFLTQVRFQEMINKDQLNFIDGKIEKDNWLISRDQIVNQKSINLENT